MACGGGGLDETWTCRSCGFTAPTQDGIRLLAPGSIEGDGTDASYLFDAITAAERSHFWFRARNRLIDWALDRYFPGATSLLDVGCGTGGVAAFLRSRHGGLRVTAADAVLSGLKRARQRLDGATFLQLDIRNLPFEDEFDVVGAFDVLEHLDDDRTALHQIRKAAGKRGGIIITVPQHAFLWSRVDEFSRHRRRYSRRDLVAKVQDAGFDVLKVTSFVSLLLPALLVSRMREKRKAFDPIAEYRISPSANAAFGAVMAGEFALLSAGMPLPAGGSLLLVGRRR